MKKCPKCQTYYTDEDKFCKKCGTLLEDVSEAPKKEVPKKKSRKPLLIAVLCALFVIGLLLGLLLGRGGSDQKTEQTQQTEKADKKEKGKDKKKAAKDLKDKISKGDDKQDKKDDKKDDKKAGGDNFYEAEWCSFSYPEAWVGKVDIKEHVYEKMRTITISMIDNGGYGGLLYEIDLSDYPFSEDTSSDKVYYNPGYKETLGTSTTGVYAHLVGPTDVQFSPENQQQYKELYEQDLGIIRDTFEFNY